MTFTTRFRYYNPVLRIAMDDLKTVYLLLRQPVQLHPEVRRGRLVYRAHGSSRRVSYEQIKKGLIRKETVLLDERPNWL